jgi:tagatose-1,6-bisphosphate aldolase non-catalytic subunit AgaZ/GatZ
MSEPMDLTGMTPAQARRAVRAAAQTMEIPKRRHVLPGNGNAVATPGKASTSKPDRQPLSKA